MAIRNTSEVSVEASPAIFTILATLCGDVWQYNISLTQFHCWKYHHEIKQWGMLLEKGY